MDLLSWMAGGFIIIGFIIVVAMKKGMEHRLALIEGNAKAGENKNLTRPIVWWIWGTVIWGIASIFLIVWWFFENAS